MFEEFYAVLSTPGSGEIALVAILVFVCVLLLSLLVRSKWNWIIKSTATIITGGLFALAFVSIIDMQGWPTTDTIPETFQFVGYYVDNPNPMIGKEGFIVIWILEMNKEIGKKPRSYIIPYSKEMHKKLQEAKKRRSAGQAIKGERINKKQRKGNFAESLDDLEFYDMPKPSLPPK